MSHILHRTASCLLFAVVSTQLGYSAPQSGNALRDFFVALVDHYDPSSLPTHQELLKVTRPILGAAPEEITVALPSIFRALEHPDDNVKLDAAGALIVIAVRADSSELLRSHIPEIASLLDSPNKRLPWDGVAILGYLKPVPPPEVAAPLLNFLKEDNRDLHAQTGLIGVLARAVPNNPDVIAAIEQFLSHPLDDSTRIDVLNVLGDTPTGNPRLIRIVIAALNNPYPTVTLAAMRALTRMGQGALLQARSALEAVAQSRRQPADVREAARQALDSLRRP